MTDQIHELEQRKPGIASGRVTDAFSKPLPEDELRHWE